MAFELLCLVERPSEERAYSISLINSLHFVNCVGTENRGSKLLWNIGNIYWSLRPGILEHLSFQQNRSKNLKSRNTAYVYVSFHKFVKVCWLEATHQHRPMRNSVVGMYVYSAIV
jgi:hypothetical protein